MAAAKGTPGTTVTDGTGRVIGRYDSQGNFIPTSGGGQGSSVSGQAATRAAGFAPAAATPSANTTMATGGAAMVPGGQEGLTGFASRYSPTALQDMVYDSPETVLYDLFQQMGIGNQGSGLYQQLADFGGADPLSLYMLQTGGSQDSLGAQNANDYTNWLASQYQNGATAGGGAFDFQSLLGNVFGMNPDASQNNSTLYNLITAGTPTQQVSNLYNMARDAGRVGLNPLAQTAMLTSLQRAAQGYQSQAMQGASGDAANSPFYQYLNEQNPGLVQNLTGR